MYGELLVYEKQELGTLRMADCFQELGETQEVAFLELSEGTKLTDTLTLIIWPPRTVN